MQLREFLDSRVNVNGMEVAREALPVDRHDHMSGGNGELTEVAHEWRVILAHLQQLCKVAPVVRKFARK